LDGGDAGLSHWLHVDLPHRLSHTGLPVTTVTADDRAAATADRRLALTRNG
jgi:hypothetical protein